MRRMTRTRSAVVLTTLAVAGSMLVLGGCESGHGKHVQKHKEMAEERLSQLKSGTEWQMAKQRFLAGDLKRAREGAERSIALNGNVGKSHLLLGRIELEEGDLESAMRSFARAQELEPENAESFYYQGLVFERIGQSQRAYDAYAKAAELDVTDPQYAVAAAEMLMEMGRLQDAEAMLRDRIDRFELNPAIYQTLGHIAMLLENPSHAAGLFGQASMLAPDDTRIMEDLIRAQIASGDFAEAEYHLGRLLGAEEHADRRDLMHLRAQCLIRLNQPVEAREILLELTADAEGKRDLMAWERLGQVAALLDDQARLRTASQRLIAMRPDRASGYILRAMYHRASGDLDKALRDATFATQRAANDASMHVFRGVILQDMGRNVEAAKMFAMATRLDPAHQAAAQLWRASQNNTTNAGTAITGHGAATD